ncbi:WbqC family protein [Streptomyces sp. NPDC046985]|uniref:WbqC family protein n=1 Tax=Streptomyces sp. NPDC046985 TaxID=3155377 RepID=UPI0033FAF23C
MSATPSSDCAGAATTPGSWPTDHTRPATRASALCAIHQPNLFPRLATLAKLYAADYWIVLDDVQFARRDYQHRTRLASLNDPGRRQWLTLPTRLPHGRATLIREARLVDPAKSRRRLRLLLQQYYGAAPHRAHLHTVTQPLLDLMDETDRTADIAEASTWRLLHLLGWRGHITRSSTLPARSGRSERLADLTRAIGADAYLCGTGGMRYLHPEPFRDHAIDVVPFSTPTTGGPWTDAREISALWAVMTYGPQCLSSLLCATEPI